jgi:hypothetical protein
VALTKSVYLCLAVLTATATSTLAEEPAAAGRTMLEAGLDIRRETPHPWYDATRALCMLHLEHEVDEANRLVRAVALGWPVDVADKKEPEAYWAFSALVRIVVAHGASGTGRLSSGAEEDLKALFWDYTSPRSRPDPSETWMLAESENHDLMRKSVHYLMATAYAVDPNYRDRPYVDGKTASDHRDRWSAYFRAFCEERARKGLFVEVASPTYQKYHLQCLINLRDLSPDAEVRRLVENLLHLLWADWAQDQLGGLRGGGKSRSYPGKYSRNGAIDGMTQAAELYFDFPGSAGFGGLPTLLMATSDYRPPDIVRRIALSRPVSAYTSLSRRPGAGQVTRDPRGYGRQSDVDPNKSTLRVVRVTPDYVFGTTMFDPESSHVGVSAQNRWSGVIFPTGPDRRVYIGCGSAREDKPQTYDALITAQSGPVLVARKKREAHRYNLVPYIVVPSSLEVRLEREGWVFVQEGAAYAGVYVLGAYSWEEDRVVPADEWAPILMAVGRQVDDGSFAAFQERLLNMKIQERVDEVVFQCMGEEMAVSRQADRLPLVNGRSPNLEPAFTYQSPYVNAVWDAPVVRVSCGAEEMILDFHSYGPR